VILLAENPNFAIYRHSALTMKLTDSSPIPVYDRHKLVRNLQLFDKKEVILRNEFKDILPKAKINS